MAPSLTSLTLFTSLLALIPPASAHRPIFTLPDPPLASSWFENLAVRPNGNILATRGDAPEI